MPWFLAGRTLRKAIRLNDELDLKIEAKEAWERTQRYLARKDRLREVSFIRGGRRLDVLLPPEEQPYDGACQQTDGSFNTPVGAEYKRDLFLLTAGPNHVRTAQVLCRELKLKIPSVIKMMDAVPVKIVDDVLDSYASLLIAKLVAVGAEAELRNSADER